jgi:hypothetical protein
VGGEASGGNSPEIDVHRLERARTWLNGLDVAGCDVPEQRTERSRWGGASDVERASAAA